MPLLGLVQSDDDGDGWRERADRAAARDAKIAWMVIIVIAPIVVL
jgi:hypothetical protein